MAKLEKLPFFNIKVDADLISFIWKRKRKFYYWSCHYKSLFWYNLFRKIKGLPKYKRDYAPTRKGRYSYPPVVFIQISGHDKPLECGCKNNADMERAYKKLVEWINTRKTDSTCKFKVPD